jgi:hypothetical protein
LQDPGEFLGSVRIAMRPFLLAGLIGLSIVAVAEASRVTWKIRNLAIIVAFMGAGIGIGYLLAWRSIYAGEPSDAAISLCLTFGFAAALGCLRRNKSRGRVDQL